MSLTSGGDTRERSGLIQQRDAARRERDEAQRVEQEIRKALVAVLDDHAKQHPGETETGPYRHARALLRST